MVELLKELNIPIIIIILLVIFIPLVTLIFKNKLEKQRQKFSLELNKIQEIHSKRFDLISELSGLSAEFRHCVYNLNLRFDEVYSENMMSHYKSIRETIRRSIIILNADIEKSAYTYTDYGIKVNEKDFEYVKFNDYEVKFKNHLNDLMKTIPKISEAITNQ